MRLKDMGDTIAAVATPAGEGGIGIIRVSGPNAVGILKSIFLGMGGTQKASFETHKMYLGKIMSQDGAPIDQVLAVSMRAPKSYTGEDVVEIHCHGGSLVMGSILKQIISRGARLAEPGEFTKRAFLNGKLDLAQAESVADIISSRSEQGLRLAMQGLAGRLSDRIHEIKERLTGVMAQIEASIDFPEDVADDMYGETIHKTLEETADGIKKMISEAGLGRAYREGISVVIAGRPNVGKSSIFNTLVREHRAIVTEIPGTTRDIISDYINIRGIPVRVMDTAGIRETADIVESEGVKRSKKQVEEADIVLYVLDSSAQLDEEDISMIEYMKQKNLILVLNKTDLNMSKSMARIYERYKGLAVVETSVAKSTGLDDLENEIIKMVSGRHISADEIMVTNIRHEDALREAEKHLKEAVSAMDRQIPMDLVAIDIKLGLDCLGEITGETIDEDIIDRIFHDFCIGK